jgi:hypothetical protein
VRSGQAEFVIDSQAMADSVAKIQSLEKPAWFMQFQKREFVG